MISNAHIIFDLLKEKYPQDKPKKVEMELMRIKSKLSAILFNCID